MARKRRLRKLNLEKRRKNRNQEAPAQEAPKVEEVVKSPAPESVEEVEKPKKSFWKKKATKKKVSEE